MSRPLPAIFLGHGNPMNAVAQNAFTDGWRALGRAVGRPRAVLAISAHWYIPETAATAMAAPRTIHDFGGFPEELYRYDYPAPGDSSLARRLRDVLAPTPIRLDESWGLDHGTWAVLCHVFPDADVPVVQLSIDRTQAPAFHFELGRKLAPLRDEGVLIVGSGNLIHNLRLYAWGRRAQEPYDWALRFEDEARRLIDSRRFDRLIDYPALGPDAARAIPTPEHFLPLLYVLGAARKGDPIAYPVDGIEGGSISMLSVKVG